MTSEPEPGSPADLDERKQQRNAESERIAERENIARELEYKKRNRDDKLVIMASVIASGLVHRVFQPAEVAAQSVDVALHILQRVEALP